MDESVKALLNALTNRISQPHQQQVAPGKTDEAPGYALPDFGHTPSRIDAVKSTFIEWTALTVPFMLALLLAISNGYFFSGFKDFTLHDVSVVVAWGSGFAIEMAALAAIFHAAQRLKSGKRKDFAISLTWALVLAAISFLAQYVYLQMEVVRGTLQVNDSAIDKMPLFSLLVGTGGLQGHDVLFLVRTSAYHVAEIACTFLFTSKGTSIEAAIRREQEKFTYRTMIETQQTVLQLMTSVRAKEKHDLSVTAAEFLPATTIMQEPVVPEAEKLPEPVLTQQIDLGELAALIAKMMQGQSQEHTGETQKTAPVHPLMPLLNARKTEQQGQ